jgi:hypothetical protein
MQIQVPKSLPPANGHQPLSFIALPRLTHNGDVRAGSRKGAYGVLRPNNASQSHVRPVTKVDRLDDAQAGSQGIGCNRCMNEEHRCVIYRALHRETLDLRRQNSGEGPCTHSGGSRLRVSESVLGVACVRTKGYANCCEGKEVEAEKSVPHVGTYWGGWSQWRNRLPHEK